MQNSTKDKVAGTVGAASGVATGPVAVVSVAGGATSASAITEALALIGGGSMLGGVAVIGVAAVGVFFVVRKLAKVGIQYASKSSPDPPKGM